MVKFNCKKKRNEMCITHIAAFDGNMSANRQTCLWPNAHSHASTEFGCASILLAFFWPQ